MNDFIEIGPNTWVREASRGWVVYVVDDAYYFAENEKDKAQAVYDQARAEGKWASPPMPAHMGG